MFNRELYPVLEWDRQLPSIAFTPYAVFLDAAVSAVCSLVSSSWRTAILP